MKYPKGENATRIVVAGNVAQDLGPDGGWVPGGPALYAARMAAALGAEVDLVTRLADDYDRSVLEGIHVIAVRATRSCRYANSYDARGDRTQLLLAEGEPLDLRALPPGRADACILAPAYHELEEVPAIGAGVVGVSLQGPLRTTDGGRVVYHPDPVAQVEPFLATGRLAFLSEEDTADGRQLARYIAGRGAIALLTRGYRGAVMFTPERELGFEAIPASAVDPTGAGDCFSTAFVVRLVETSDLVQACRFALAAGSLAVEGIGIAGIPTRAAVEERLERVAA